MFKRTYIVAFLSLKRHNIFYLFFERVMHVYNVLILSTPLLPTSNSSPVRILSNNKTLDRTQAVCLQVDHTIDTLKPKRHLVSWEKARDTAIGLVMLQILLVYSSWEI